VLAEENATATGVGMGVRDSCLHVVQLLLLTFVALIVVYVTCLTLPLLFLLLNCV